MLSLILSFFTIALLYATVGFGGGSSYLAMLAVSNVPYELMPKIALVCNLLVVTSGSYLYYKSGYFSKKLILPFMMSSVPMAFLGGLYPVSEKVFLGLLATSLLFAGLRVIFVKNHEAEATKLPSLAVSLIVGGLLGLLSGVVGIGGGIFLSPIMLNLKWGKAKEVAAVASCFILVNSISGLIGQLAKSGSFDVFSYWPLFVSVIIGGQIGSRISIHHKVTQIYVQRGTGILILMIAGRLLIKQFQ
jgi:uncharacterized membrane protein YfcA